MKLEEGERVELSRPVKTINGFEPAKHANLARFRGSGYGHRTHPCTGYEPVEYTSTLIRDEMVRTAGVAPARCLPSEGSDELPRPRPDEVAVMTGIGPASSARQADCITRCTHYREMAGVLGFEPRLRGSEPHLLPVRGLPNESG